MLLRRSGLLGLLLLVSCAVAPAQNPKSITFLRLGTKLVDQYIQPPPPGENWLTVLRQMYRKAGVQADQLSEESLPGVASKVLVCSLKGRGDSFIVVSASSYRPADEDAANVAWASLAMLPIVAESLGGVSTESTILLVAFPDSDYRHPASEFYVRHLSPGQRAKIKAAVEVSAVGRGRTTFENRRGEGFLSDWLATAALTLHMPPPLQAWDDDTVAFTSARSYHGAGVPAITISSLPQRIPRSFSATYKPLNRVVSEAYYSTYQLLCVFLVDLDRVPRGATPHSVIKSSAAVRTSASKEFTSDEASNMVFGQINDERARHGSRSLRWLNIPELQSVVCDMARHASLDAKPVDELLTEQKLTGFVTVASRDYPNLTPEQLQPLKIGRYQRLTVATCVVPPAEGKPTAYWMVAVAYE